MPHFFSSLVVTIGLAGFGALSACSSTPLRVVPSGTTIPLATGAEPGTVLGRCLRIESSGPTTHPCPAAVGQLLADPVEHRTSGRGTYAHGIFVLTEDRASLAAEGAAEVAIAYELATFGSASVAWKVTLEGKDRKAVEAVCAARESGAALVVRELTGCSVAMIGDKTAAAEWTIASLARHGAVIGRPKNFWVQDPGQSRAPDTAECKARRVVAAEIIPLSVVCDRFGGVRSAGR